METLIRYLVDFIDGTKTRTKYMCKCGLLDFDKEYLLYWSAQAISMCYHILLKVLDPPLRK